MTLIKTITLAALLGLTAHAARAAEPRYFYECDMRDVKQARGWISAKLALVFPGDGSVKIVDALTMHFNKEPLTGKVLRNNAQRLVVKWTIKGARADSGRSFANLDYRASISKRNGAIELTVIPRSFDAGLRSAGTCKRRRK